MRRINKRMQKGFTIVELSLSLAFIAILSIIVVIVIGNAVSAYHRGLTLNQLNTTGMDIVEEMRTTLQSSQARSVERECEGYTNSRAKQNCEADGGLRFIYNEHFADVQIGSNKPNVPVYGVFCTGTYSYLWNAGYFFNDEYKKGSAEPLRFVYSMKNEDNLIFDEKDSNGWYNLSNFRLLKVQDKDGEVCKAAAGTQYDGNFPGEIRLESSLDDEPVELLGQNSSLAIYSLTTATPARSGVNNMLYAVSFILGTIQGGVNISGGGNYCATPEDFENADVENFDYCAINKFNFAAQATGGRK